MGLILTLLHSEWPKLHRVLAILSVIGLKNLLQLHSFGHSECNRVKEFASTPVLAILSVIELKNSLQLHRVLAVPSATGLKNLLEEQILSSKS